MFLYRSLTVGLLGACFLLLTTYEAPVPVAAAPPAVAAHAMTGATLVDVAHTTPPALLLSLIRIEEDEHVVAVDDQLVESDLDARAAILRPRQGGYIDVTIGGSAHERRVLVLLH
ncbi:MAG: hypothetical protein H0T79_10365 [Deltaproteobacteria bacterium]|nr:hypothetical protein [Deltaproteobacteria bacterium]